MQSIVYSSFNLHYGSSLGFLSSEEPNLSLDDTYMDKAPAAESPNTESEKTFLIPKWHTTIAFHLLPWRLLPPDLLHQDGVDFVCHRPLWEFYEIMNPPQKNAQTYTILYAVWVLRTFVIPGSTAFFCNSPHQNGPLFPSTPLSKSVPKCSDLQCN